MPNVSLGKREGARLSVICKSNAVSDVLFKLNAMELKNVVSGIRGDYAYILADLEDRTVELKIAGIIRYRVIQS